MSYLIDVEFGNDNYVSPLERHLREQPQALDLMVKQTPEVNQNVFKKVLRK